MKKGQLVELLIEKTRFPSIGIGIIDGKNIEVKKAILGEKLLIKISRNRTNKIEGKIIKVLEESPYTKKALCPHVDLCGGCTHQQIPYDLQLKWKENEIIKLFKDANIKIKKYEGIKKSPLEYQYRNKMEFTFGNMEKDGPLTLGLHQPGKFYNIIQTNQCKIVDEDYNIILEKVSLYCKDNKLTFYNKMNGQGYLRHLLIRKSFNKSEILINIITSTQIKHDFTDLVKEIKELKLNNTIIGFLHTRNDSKSDAIINQGYDILYGRDYIIEEVLGLLFKITTFSFFQTNSLGAEKLYKIVQEYIGDTSNKIIFDLYCGTGTIAQIVSSKAKKVYGIELVEEAVEAAKENAILNDIENVEFIVGDVGKSLKEINQKPDIIIVDPPRAGISPKALKQVIEYNVDEIIYVSCNAKTLVENIADMTKAGYQVERMTLMDMFPHTGHVECIALIRREIM